MRLINLNFKTGVLLAAILWLGGCGGLSGALIKPPSPPAASEPEKTTAAPLPEPSRPSSPPPDWVLGRGHPSFPQSRYLTGIGAAGKDTVAANNSARSELAKSLRVRVVSTWRDTSTLDKTQIESVIASEVDSILDGVEIKDGWYDQAKGVYYSLAVLERALAARAIEERLRALQAARARGWSEGVAAEERGETVPALASYLRGEKDAAAFLSLQQAAWVITRREEPQNNKAAADGGPDFAGKIEQLVHGLRLEAVSGQEQTLKNRQDLPAPLAAGVFMQNGGSRQPVRGAGLIFQYEQGGGDIEKEKTTGADGLAQAAVRGPLSLEDTSHIVSARLDLGKIQAALGGDSAHARKLLAPWENLRATFRYSIDAPRWGAGKSQAWKAGITGLVNQTISKLPSGGKPTLGVFAFRGHRQDNKATAFDQILLEDFKTVLARAEDLTVKEIQPDPKRTAEETAKEQKLDYFITGSYRLSQTGLELRAQLTETATRRIYATGNAEVARAEIDPRDLALMGGPAGGAQHAEGFSDHLEKLVNVKPDGGGKFNVKIRADKTDYKIGDKIKFYLQADAACYVTLLNIHADGSVERIFPNSYNDGKNRLRPGYTHEIPADGDRFNFEVTGPAGLERVKVIATGSPASPFGQDASFFAGGALDREAPTATRDIKILAEHVAGKNSAAWGEAVMEFFIHERNEGPYMRGGRKIPFEKPKKPIDIIGTFGNEAKPESPQSEK